jgi:hypothetical protein
VVLREPPVRLFGLNLPLDGAMARARDLFINHYDDPGASAFAFWLRLTETGKSVA